MMLSLQTCVVWFLTESVPWIGSTIEAMFPEHISMPSSNSTVKTAHSSSAVPRPAPEEG